MSIRRSRTRGQAGASSSATWPGSITGPPAGPLPPPPLPSAPPPTAGRGRRARSADRLEAEPTEFHERVRAGFLALAQAGPERYLVLDASRPAGELSHEIQDRLRDLLPDPVPSVAEANTGSFPAIVD